MNNERITWLCCVVCFGLSRQNVSGASLGGKYLRHVNAIAPASMWMIRYAISSTPFWWHVQCACPALLSIVLHWHPLWFGKLPNLPAPFVMMLLSCWCFASPLDPISRLPWLSGCGCAVWLNGLTAWRLDGSMGWQFTWIDDPRNMLFSWIDDPWTILFTWIDDPRTIFDWFDGSTAWRFDGFRG